MHEVFIAIFVAQCNQNCHDKNRLIDCFITRACAIAFVRERRLNVFNMVIFQVGPRTILRNQTESQTAVYLYYTRSCSVVK